jgi:hypothetical protein
MELLISPVIPLVIPLAAVPVLVLVLLRRRGGRRTTRAEAALAEVESASPAVIADWPCGHLEDLSRLLAAERAARSAEFRQGLHTAASREKDWSRLERVAAAERQPEQARALDGSACPRTRRPA